MRTYAVVKDRYSDMYDVVELLGSDVMVSLNSGLYLSSLFFEVISDSLTNSIDVAHEMFISHYFKGKGSPLRFVERKGYCALRSLC